MTRKIVKGKIIWTCCYKNCVKKAVNSYELNNGKYVQFCEEHDIRNILSKQKLQQLIRDLRRWYAENKSKAVFMYANPQIFGDVNNFINTESMNTLKSLVEKFEELLK